MNIYLIADYGYGDLAWAEVEAALRNSLDVQQISRVSLPTFDTWACALALAQLSEQAGRDDIVFHNVAPRKDDISPRINNEGEPLLAGRSGRGALFLGPNSGHSWSMVYPSLSSLRAVSCNNGGSQFRSRDIFPQTIPLLLFDAPGIWGEEIIPANMPAARILMTDGYGNLKTSLQGDYSTGQTVVVSINGYKVTAFVASESFSGEEGQLLLSRGSSGDLWELFLRGGSAAALFGFPSGGSSIEIF